MLHKGAIAIWTALIFTAVASAQTPGLPALSGKDFPLTLHLKDLDSNWRVFNAGSDSNYMNLIASAMTGGAGKVFTKGDTVTVGSEVFLVAYKPEGAELSAAMLSGGGPPKPKPMTANSVLRLSLMNLHALSAMDGIRTFDLKDLVAEEQTNPMVDIISKMSSGSGSDVAKEPALLKNGSAAPDFTVRDDSGNPVKLSSYRGKVVVLDFWATWCGPCQDSLPGTAKIAAKYAKKDVVVLGVNVWDEKKAFHDWLPKHKSLSPIRFAIDTHGQGQDVATKLYHVSGIPTQYIVDAKGHIVGSTVGYDEGEPDLKKDIELALTRR